VLPHSSSRGFWFSAPRCLCACRSCSTRVRTGATGRSGGYDAVVLARRPAPRRVVAGVPAFVLRHRVEDAAVDLTPRCVAEGLARWPEKLRLAMAGFEALAVTQSMPSIIVEAKSASSPPRTFAGYGTRAPRPPRPVPRPRQPRPGPVGTVPTAAVFLPSPRRSTCPTTLRSVCEASTPELMP